VTLPPLSAVSYTSKPPLLPRKYADIGDSMSADRPHWWDHEVMSCEYYCLHSAGGDPNHESALKSPNSLFAISQARCSSEVFRAAGAYFCCSSFWLCRVGRIYPKREFICVYVPGEKSRAPFRSPGPVPVFLAGNAKMRWSNNVMKTKTLLNSRLRSGPKLSRRQEAASVSAATVPPTIPGAVTATPPTTRIRTTPPLVRHAPPMTRRTQTSPFTRQSTCGTSPLAGGA